jgi:ABC-type multidrug transport system fused ATPase/permease subunit
MTEDKTIGLRQVFTKLKPYITHYKNLLAGLAVLGVLKGGVDFIYIFLIKTLTDTALSGDMTTFTHWVYLTAGFLLFAMLVMYLSVRVDGHYQAYTIRDFRNAVSAHVQKLPLSYTDTLHSGDLISRLNNDIGKIGELLANIMVVFSRPVVFVLAFVYMAILSWKLLLVTCIIVPISAVFFNKVVIPIQAHSQKVMEALARANAVTEDAIRGIYIVKAFNLQGLLTGKFRTIAEQVEKEGIEIRKREAVATILFLTGRFIPQLICPLYGGYLAFHGEISPGTLLASLSLIWQIFIPVEMLLDALKQMREAAPAVERVFEIMDHPADKVDGGEFQADREAAPLQLEQVSFSYSAGQPIFNGLSLEVKEGETIGLVGPSGCGKSTLFKLLCGFYAPQSGRVRLYGEDIFRSDLAGARSLISLVSQDTFLFPTTLFENIAYGRLGATPAEVENAARAANAHEFILQQPKGYDTPAGEWGVRLSGGERQRIALARAILKDAPILLLDEPTSALDTQSEALVQEALERLMRCRTVLIVAHRLSTIKNVDRILVLDKGRICEMGTHDQLMSRDSLYKRLYLKQTAESSKNTYGSWEVQHA